MSAIRNELMTAAEVAPKRGESEADFKIRLQKAISTDISDDVWNALSDPAQDWNNEAAEDITHGRPIRPFPDEKAEEPAAAPAPATRRRGAAAEPAAAPAVAAYEPTKGDEVEVTSKRNKVTVGFIVDMDADVLVLNPAKDGPEADDVECPRDGATVKHLVPEPAAAPAPSTRTRGAAAAAPTAPAEPQVGDTVTVETLRGKVITGNIEVLEGDDLVLKDASGADHELALSKLKSFTLKVSNAAAAAPAPATSGRSRGAAAAPAPAADGKPARSVNPPGVSVGLRIRELVVGNPAITVDACAATLTKEGLQFRPATVGMIHKETLVVIDLLKAAGKLK